MYNMCVYIYIYTNTNIIPCMHATSACDSFVWALGPWVAPLDWEGKGVSDIVGNLVWFVLVCPWAMGP